jgi:dipeptidyl aminopeptidase/acylaminoacyl peptidase
MAELPTWEQRMRAPALLPGSLVGPAISWAKDRADRGVLLANPGGRTEVFRFDSSTVPATLTQVTDRPAGTLGAAISPDGESVFWFDDRAGDELGRWECQRVGDRGSATLLADLLPAYPAGIAPLADGRVFVGRMLDTATSDGVGFELAVATAGGSGRVVYRCPDPADLVDVAHDGELALLGFAPAGDWLHTGVRVVRVSDGAVVAQLVDDGRSLVGAGFHPADADRVLLTHERLDFSTPALWSPTTGQLTDVGTSFEGDVSASWYPDGRALLVSVLRDARHRLFRLDLGSRQVTPLVTRPGTVAASCARPDGSVHALLSASDQPVSLIRLANGTQTSLVVLPGPVPAPVGPVADVYVEGPSGRIHALVHQPAGRSAPYPTVFMPHGGPTAQDLDVWNDRVAALVDCGYAVVRVNYRGSTGYGAAWRDALHRQLGFIELEDIGAVRDYLERTGVVDPPRVSIVGGSWGGFLTLMALGTQPDRWRSGAAMVPLADQVTAAEDSPSFMKAYDAALMGGTIEELPDAYRAASPITYAEAVIAPLFVTAGENDPRCPVRQVDTYVQRLRDLGKTVRYERSPTGHWLPDVDMRVAEMRRLVEFLAETLPV